MQKNNRLKGTVILLIILIISFVSFLGIYTKGLYKYENILPEYYFDMNLNGAMSVSLKIDETENEVAKDASGNIVEDYEEGQEGITIEKTKVNKEEILTSENFVHTKDIIEKRLKQMGLNEYRIRLDQNIGNITAEIPEEIDSGKVISVITAKGTFALIDSNTKEVLLSNKDILKTKAVYNSSQDGYTAYLFITFNKDGAKKLEEISNAYIETTDEEGNVTKKQVTINIDGQEFMTTSFGETMTTGILSISVGAVTTDTNELKNNLDEATQIAALIGNGEAAIQYKIETANYLFPTINIQNVLICISVMFAFAVISLLYLVIKYDMKGIYGWSSIVSFVALTLLAIRYTRNNN